MKKDKILVITAHPDDAELLFGGTIHKYSKNGHDVDILIVTNGESWNKIGILDREKIIRLRKKEAKKAGKILGIKNISFLDLKDGLVNRVELIPILIDEIRKSNPNIILTHSESEGHYDHKEVSYCVKRVCNLSGEPAPIINPYWDTDEKPLESFKGLFLHHVDGKSVDFLTTFISLKEEDIVAKANAIKEFETQFPDIKQMEEKIYYEARNNGLISQVDFAEVFENVIDVYPRGKDLFSI